MKCAIRTSSPPHLSYPTSRPFDSATRCYPKDSVARDFPARYMLDYMLQ